MKAIKRILAIVVVLIVLVGALLAAGLFFARRHLQSPAFKEQMLAAARSELGTDVTMTDMQVSLFSGVTLRGIAVANPRGFPGQMLTAEALVLRYRLLPLLRRRVEIEQLWLDAPVITLARNEKKEWNYEKTAEKTPAPAPTPRTAPSGAVAGAPPLDIALSKLAVTRGAVLIVSEKGKSLVRIEGVNFSSSVDFTGAKLSGAGKATVDSVNVADLFSARQLAGPVAISTDAVQLAPLTASLAAGDVTGQLSLRLAGGFKYNVDLQVKDGDVSKLLEQAGAKPAMTGKLLASAKLEGTAGLATIVGNGRAEIVGGRINEIPLLNLLASLLQAPELRELGFDECLLEFSIAHNRMQTPVVRLTSPKVRLTGKGVVLLEDYSLKHDMRLALAKGMLDKLPKEIRNTFTEQPDGFLTIDFQVWGPYDSPKTDLKDRIVKGAAQQLIEKGLQKLFK